jgi:hypothetical protein
VNESQLGVNIGFPMDNVLVSVGSCDKHFCGCFKCWVCMSISTYQLGSAIKFFFNLDIGYEHEYSNALDMDILSESI